MHYSDFDFTSFSSSCFVFASSLCICWMFVVCLLKHAYKIHSSKIRDLFDWRFGSMRGRTCTSYFLGFLSYTVSHFARTLTRVVHLPEQPQKQRLAHRLLPAGSRRSLAYTGFSLPLAAAGDPDPSESPSKYFGHKSMHSLERFLTGFMADGGGLDAVTCSGLTSTAAGTLSVVVVAPAAVGVTGLASPSPWWCSSSWDFELIEEQVTPDEGRSAAWPAIPVWLLYTDLDSLLRTALPRAPVLRRLLKRGFRSWTGVVSVLSSGWGAAQFSVVTVNSMSARTSFPAVGLGGLLGWVELVEGVKQKGRALTRECLWIRGSFWTGYQQTTATV